MMGNAVIDVPALLKEFRLQIIFRCSAAFLSVSVIFAPLMLLTSSLKAWWFHELAWLIPAAKFLQQHNPWDLFVYIFVATTAVAFFQRLGEAVLERHNFKRLKEDSRKLIADAEDKTEAMSREKSLLGVRRLTLNGLLRMAYAFAQLVTLASWMFLIWLPVAAGVTLGLGVAMWMIAPWLIERFRTLADKGSEVIKADALLREGMTDDGEPDEEIVVIKKGQMTDEQRVEAQSVRARAQFEMVERRLADVAARSLLRIQGGWPGVVIAVVGVVAAATATVIAMTADAGVGGRAVLLLAVLVTLGRGAMSSVQGLEEVAFFASGAIIRSGGDTE